MDHEIQTDVYKDYYCLETVTPVSVYIKLLGLTYLTANYEIEQC